MKLKECRLKKKIIGVERAISEWFIESLNLIKIIFNLTQYKNLNTIFEIQTKVSNYKKNTVKVPISECTNGEGVFIYFIFFFVFCFPMVGCLCLLIEVLIIGH